MKKVKKLVVVTSVMGVLASQAVFAEAAPQPTELDKQISDLEKNTKALQDVSKQVSKSDVIVINNDVKLEDFQKVQKDLKTLTVKQAADAKSAQTALDATKVATDKKIKEVDTRLTASDTAQKKATADAQAKVAGLAKQDESFQKQLDAEKTKNAQQDASLSKLATAVKNVNETLGSLLTVLKGVFGLK